MMRSDELQARCELNASSSPHDVNRKNTALVSRQEIIDKIANNRVRLIAKLCHYAANQCSATRVPLEVDRSMNVASTVYFGPAMRTARLLMPDLDKTEFFLQVRIAHDFVPQRSGPGRDYLNYSLH